MKYVNLKNSDTRKKSRPKFLIPALVFLILIVFGFGFWMRSGKSMFDPISIVSSVTASTLKETDGRINVLLLGSDKRDAGALTIDAVRTDTILVASISRVDGSVVLISVPRDLWVQSPRGYHTKINGIYQDGGAKDLEKVLEDVLGMPIHYYALVDFNLFEQSVDALGGVTVNIETSFDDYMYPIEGKENAPENERYEVLHFVAGPVQMDGKLALKYARSRHGNNNEGTDFARAKRQQKVILAIKEKALSAQTLLNPSKLKDLYDVYSKNVDTDIDFGTAQGFYLLAQRVDFSKVKSIVLDDRSSSEQGGLLYSPTDTSLYGGAYVLIPRAGDYSQLHAYVQRYIFGE